MSLIDSLPKTSVTGRFYRIITFDLPDVTQMDPLFRKPLSGRYGTRKGTVHLASTISPGAWTEVVRHAPTEIERRLKQLVEGRGPLQVESLIGTEMPGGALGVVYQYELDLPNVIDLTTRDARALIQEHYLRSRVLTADPSRDPDGKFVYRACSEIALKAEARGYSALKVPSAALLDFPSDYNLAVLDGGIKKIRHNHITKLGRRVPTIEPVLLCNYRAGERPSILNSPIFRY